MAQSYTILHVDDDPLFRKMTAHLFERAGHTVYSCEDSNRALEQIRALKPECVLTDLMMPGIDGMTLVKLIRDDPELSAIKVVVASSKNYEFDKSRAYEMGADGYITKSTATGEMVSKLEQIIADKVELTFWGSRGTLPVCGKRSLRYGGNTACVTLELPRDHFFIFDAGTGLKELSDHLMAQRRALTRAKLFITHPHWDHINAFPYFAPLFIPGNDIEILGAAHGGVGIEQLLSQQMDGVYFPIKMKAFGAHLHYRNLEESSIEFDGIRVDTLLLNHPGNCLGYRVQYNNRVVCYVTDNELYPVDSPFYDAPYLAKLKQFVHQADVLITDCCYRDEEYGKKIHWGHSRPREVCALAHDAQVKHLYLFHHDPSQDDDAIDAKLAEAQAHLCELGSTTEVHLAADFKKLVVER